jgi:ethanolamine utilization protein EutN
MFLGRVVGRIWSTVKHPKLEGQRLLVVQPLTPEMAATGRRIVCTDCTGAGTGSLIYWCRGKESSFPFLPTEVPTDNNIVGIVDEIHINRQARTEIDPPPAVAAVPAESAAVPAPATARVSAPAPRSRARRS